MELLQHHAERFNQASKQLFDQIAVELSAELERRAVEKYHEIDKDLQRLRASAPDLPEGRSCSTAARWRR